MSRSDATFTHAAIGNGRMQINAVKQTRNAGFWTFEDKWIKHYSTENFLPLSPDKIYFKQAKLACKHQIHLCIFWSRSNVLLFYDPDQNNRDFHHILHLYASTSVPQQVNFCLGISLPEKRFESVVRLARFGIFPS